MTMIDLRAMSRPILAAAFVLIGTFLSAQGTFQLAVLKYNGGGDWYANPTAVPTSTIRGVSAVSRDAPAAGDGSSDHDTESAA